MNNRLINTKVAGGGGGCTNIVDNYDPFGGGGVALYQLNGNANDVSGNYNGTASNVTYGTGVFSQAGVFNGSSSVITLPILNVSGSQPRTISAWINPQSIVNYQTIYNSGGSNGLESFSVGTKDSRIYFSSLNADLETNTGVLSTNTWYNVVVTYNGGNISTDSLKIYVNGINQNTTKLGGGTSVLNTTNLNYAIGKRTTFNDNYFNGSIDQVRIFNTALTPLEVEALYTEELCICDGTVDTLQVLGDTSCIATYQLDGNANDLSGNYSGTPTDVSYGVGEFDLAGVFNGSTSGILINDAAALRLTASYTVSFWFKINSTGSLQRIINKDDGNDYSAGYSFFIQPVGGFGWTHNDGSNGQNWDGIFFPTVGVWYNVSAVYSDSSNLRTLYLNGASAGTIATNTNIAAGTDSLNFGYIPVYNQRLNGSLDQVRIFNKALNSTEVTTLYNETACTKVTRTAGVTQILGDSSCIAYYKLDGTASDETGTYNGTFTSPDYRNGEFDLAANFNGINGEIALSNAGTTNLNLDGDFSISIWVKPLGVNAQGIYQFIYGSGVKEFGITYDPVVQRGGAYFWTGSAVASVGGDIPLSNWSNIVFSRSKTTGMKFYINNSLVDSDSFTGNGATISSAYDALGQWGRPSIDRYFKGQLDNVRFFNKAISASEVTTLYNEGI
jgi:hypothetical protein